jgi:hypothetical protein
VSLKKITILVILLQKCYTHAVSGVVFETTMLDDFLGTIMINLQLECSFIKQTLIFVCISSKLPSVTDTDGNSECLSLTLFGHILTNQDIYDLL